MVDTCRACGLDCAEHPELVTPEGGLVGLPRPAAARRS
jgi:hypothetical protein